MRLKTLWFAVWIVIFCSVSMRPLFGANAQELAEGAATVSWSPNGQYLAVSGSLGGVFIYSSKNTRGPFVSFSKISGANAIAWSPNGDVLVTADVDYSVRVWNAYDDKLLATLNEHTKPVNNIGWSRDGKEFASVGDDGKLIIWDAKTYKVLKVIQYSLPLEIVSWSPDGSKIAAGVQGASIEIWDAQGNHIDSIAGGFAKNSLNWSPDSTKLLGDNPEIIGVIDQSLGQPLETCGNPESTAWSHNGQLIVLSGITGGGGDQCFIDPSTGIVITDFSNDGPMHSMAFSPNDKQLAGVDNAGHVLVWDVKTTKALYDWPAPKSPTANIPASALSALKLMAVCSPNPDQYRMWQVTNANPYDVVFRWFVVNSPTNQFGEEVVPAAQNGKAGERLFQTNTEAGDNTLNVFSPPDKLQATAASTTAQCPAPTAAATASAP